MNLNVFDVILAGLPLAFLLLGFVHSAWREFLSLVGAAAGAVVGVRYLFLLSGPLEHVLPDRNLAEVLSYVAIFIVGFALGAFIGGLADRLQEGSRSDGNRLLPAVYGALKGLVVSLALVWLVQTHIPAFQQSMGQSRVAGLLQPLLTMLASHSPW
ncbi:MAG TPA: CvpA family protein [bacterium]|nr:CvpA family protein [bacterium]